MTGNKPGPPKRYPYTIEIKLDGELLEFVDGMREAMGGISRGQFFRALATAHMNYLEGLARQYVSSGVVLAEIEANR